MTMHRHYLELLGIALFLSRYNPVCTVQVADTGKEPNLLKHRDVKNTILEQAVKRAEPGVVPTFPEFINYVLAETKGLKGPRDWKVCHF